MTLSVFSDKDGNPVPASSDPSNTSALFFVRIDPIEDITSVDGSGIKWLRR